jgi:hypothetical protein
MGITVTIVMLCGVAVMVAVIVLHGAAVIAVTLSLDHKRGS